ncbi:MAG: septum formation protein Maf [Verrucomicrobia bacterium]|nr:MAG: septum formation protein Maf [Verrucomicrobiota bacterium]PYL62906.1 MAG: septum formation protein Maf [Verrucomicrobiota bacterium]
MFEILQATRLPLQFLAMPSLVLASSSPRRAALLSERGFEFETAPPRIAEKSDLPVKLRELTLWNAIRKGMSVAQTRPDAVVLAADTLVALGNEIIGKPVDLNEATQMLQRLSGRTHEVCSAVLIYHQTSGRSAVFHDVSRVRFHRLRCTTIKQYIAKVDPLDKAGAYAAQGSGAEIIAKIEGSFTNVVGLPMEKTIAALAKFGIRPSAA